MQAIRGKRGRMSRGFAWTVLKSKYDATICRQDLHFESQAMSL
eukprot:gene39401-15745_t